MRLLIHDLAYTIEKYDEVDFKNQPEYVENIARIIECFKTDEDIVLFPIEEEFFNDDEYYIQNREFIKERIVFINSEWIFNIPAPNDSCLNIIWFKAENRVELIEALKVDLFFNCAICKPGKNIKEAMYILNSNEEDEFNSLTIRERNKGDFIVKVIPKLQKIFGNRFEILDLR